VMAASHPWRFTSCTASEASSTGAMPPE
jgi:hypothetical protein